MEKFCLWLLIILVSLSLLFGGSRSFRYMLKMAVLSLIFLGSEVFGLNLSYEGIDQYFQGDHPLLRHEVLKRRSLDAYKNELRRSFLPEIKIDSGVEKYESEIIGNDFSPFIRAKIKVNLYRGGRDKTREDLVSIDQSLSDLSLEELRHHFLVETRYSFWMFAGISEKIKITESAISQLKKLRASIAPKVKSGLVPMSEATSVGLKYEELEYTKSKLKASLEKERRRLGFLLGLNVSEVDSLQVDYSEPWLAPLGGIDYKGANQTEKIVKLYKSAEKLKTKAKLLHESILPSVDFYTSIAYPPFQDREFKKLEDRKEWISGIRVSIPVSEFYTMKPRRLELITQAAALKAEAQMEEKKMQIQRQTLVKDLHDTMALLGRSERLHRSQEQLLKQWNQEFSRGYRGGGDISGLIADMENHERHMTDLRKNAHLVTECLRHIEMASLCFEFSHLQED